MKEVVKVVEEAVKLDVPKELFFSVVATIVDEWAIAHNVSNEEVVEAYENILAIRPKVLEVMKR